MKGTVSNTLKRKFGHDAFMLNSHRNLSPESRPRIVAPGYFVWKQHHSEAVGFRLWRFNFERCIIWKDTVESWCIFTSKKHRNRRNTKLSLCSIETDTCESNGTGKQNHQLSRTKVDSAGPLVLVCLSSNHLQNWSQQIKCKCQRYFSQHVQSQETGATAAIHSHGCYSQAMAQGLPLND